MAESNCGLGHDTEQITCDRARLIQRVREIADTYMNDPGQRRALVSDVLEAFDAAPPEARVTPSR